MRQIERFPSTQDVPDAAVNGLKSHGAPRALDYFCVVDNLAMDD